MRKPDHGQSAGNRFSDGCTREYYIFESVWTAITYSISECMGTMYNDYFIKENISLIILSPKSSSSPRQECLLKYIKRDGSIFWGEVHYKLYYDRRQKFVGSLGTMSDISERKKRSTSFWKRTNALPCNLKSWHCRGACGRNRP